MTFALTTFIVSFVLIAILIAHKLFEMHRRDTMFSKIREKVDDVVGGHISVVKGHSHMFEKGTFRTFFRIFFKSVHEAFVHAKENIAKKWHGFFHSLKTGAVKKTDGQVSVFLKDISRDKKAGEEGKKM